MSFNRNTTSLIALIALVSVIVIYACIGFNSTLLLGLLGSIATIYFGLIRTMIENDRMQKELFSEFNDRYDEDFNNLINDLEADPKIELNDKQRNLIHDYFNLCAEEYQWRTKNRIDKRVWQAWRAGIYHNITEIPAIRKIYIEATNTPNKRLSYYGLVEELGIY